MIGGELLHWHSVSSGYSAWAAPAETDGQPVDPEALHGME